MSLEIKDLHINVENKKIVKGVSLTLEKGQIQVIMGPNGSGKSTLANTLMGHPKYSIVHGEVILDGEAITLAPPHKRAQKGLFLSMQYPPEINGVTIANFLRLTKKSLTVKNIDLMSFHQELVEKMKELHIDPEFTKRYLNTGFSGGEKKKAEILQLAVLDPTYAILDETDSGLDVDALKIVAEGINKFKNKDKGILLITHYNRLLEYITPDVVHIMMDGKIIKSGGKELAEEVEKKGYKQMTKP